MITIVTDVMGTTSPLSVIAANNRHLRQYGVAFVQGAGQEIQSLVEKITRGAGLTSIEEAILHVADQIAAKNLNPLYMRLSGAVNTHGYTDGTHRGEFFDDVPVALKAWRDNGHGIYVYSNGSEESQRAMFQVAPQGDLAVYVQRFFDTGNIGPKNQAESYQKIAAVIGVAPAQILYIADALSELDAADAAGCQVKLVMRPGNKPVGDTKHQQVQSFLEITL